MRHIVLIGLKLAHRIRAYALRIVHVDAHFKGYGETAVEEQTLKILIIWASAG